ncbi:hypothetical protein CDO73_04925 [Saccharibacillus sp. O23]|uniref:DUF3999 family protein n=1 Tax=Saccharibacillus sp. O23 TaxID=2009338 RepID=UPI000B4E62EE|nr:DUF3999 family protein [Saccharibacillus sp. O23]OWR31827.1 hypothetical protein CDO73_04925 [Saccharibacillus sp. O23]
MPKARFDLEEKRSGAPSGNTALRPAGNGPRSSDEKAAAFGTGRRRASARLLGVGLAMLPLLALSAALWGTPAEARPADEQNGQPEASVVWPFSKNIDIAEGAQYQSLFLDPDVYGRAEDDLGDVRIVNASGQFVPYYLDSAEQGERGANREYKLKRIARADAERTSTFDFAVVPAAENEDVRGSVLTFDLPGGLFLKKVKLEGSYDGQRWEAAAEGTLYSAGEGRFQNSIVLDAPAKYGYYRLKVPSNTDDLDFAGGTLTDVAMSVSGEAFVRNKELPFNVEPSARMSEVTLYNADKLKIDRIKVNATASDGSSGFSRLFYVEPVKGQAANVLSPSQLNRLELGGETIDDTEIRLAQPIRGTKPKIVIDNGGNLPLDIRSIEVGYRVDRLVFEDTGTGPYRLVYGSEGARMPEYDIAAFRSQIETSKPGEASLGPETAEAFTPPGAESSGAPKDEQPRVGASASLQITFNIVLVIVALLLIAFVGRKLRKG